MKTFHRFHFGLLLLLAITLSCKNEDEGDLSVKLVNKEIYELLKEVYLWNDSLPAVNPASYSSPEALMDALRYSKYDHWSAVITKEEYNQYFEEGQMVGHGFLLSVDPDDNIRVAFVYRGTQTYNAGVRRSWIIRTVNGTKAATDNVFDLLGPSETGRTNTISFLNENGETVDLALTKEVIDITPVVYSTVINRDDKKIGYMVFQDFIDAANTEIDTLFASFASANIDELIVDMRYNGGGSVDVAQHLAGWMLGKDHGNQPFVNFRHNKMLRDWDTTLNIPGNASSFSLSRVFFIGTGSTASASELIINGIGPYLPESRLAGTTTHGKPVGMYAFPFKNYDYVVLPVTFKYTNASNEGDFYNGLSPDIEAGDDLTRNFGNPDETSLKAVLDYIRDGSIPLKNLKKTTGREDLLLRSGTPMNEYQKAY